MFDMHLPTSYAPLYVFHFFCICPRDPSLICYHVLEYQRIHFQDDVMNILLSHSIAMPYKPQLPKPLYQSPPQCIVFLHKSDHHSYPV